MVFLGELEVDWLGIDGTGKLTSVDYYLAILNVYFLKTERG